MFSYLLLRDNKQVGPYSLEELKSSGIRASDLVWVEGKSISWRFPDEIEELQPYVYASPVTSRQSSGMVAGAESPFPTENKLYSNGNREDTVIIPAIEKRATPSKDDATDQQQVSKRALDLRKNIFSREEKENYQAHRQANSQKEETGSPGMPNTDIAKVVIADDHGLFREGVKTALAQKKDIKVVGEAENGMQLLNLLKHNKADVVLLDIQMPVMDGISALSSIRKLYPDLKVIVLSMHEGHSMVSALMQSGANGYLTKTADSESIYLAIKTCQEKNYYFNELTNVSMLEGLRSKKKAPEKIVPNDFDGADLMRKLAASQKKSNGYTSSKTQTKILLAVFSVLLIGASVMAAITILGSANQLPGSVTKKKQGGFTDPLKTQQSAPIASVGTLTQQSPDSLQTKISANVTVDEKNNLLPGIAKSNSEKHPTRKFRDTANTHPAISIQQVDSAGNKNNAGQEKPSPSPASELKAMSKKYLHSLLTASSNDYHKGFFGGVSDIEITVNNRSNFTIDEAVVEVQYLLSNSKLYKTETLTFQNIQPSSSKTLEAPKSSRGSAIDYKIVSVKSKDLDL